MNDKAIIIAIIESAKSIRHKRFTKNNQRSLRNFVNNDRNILTIKTNLNNKKGFSSLIKENTEIITAICNKIFDKSRQQLIHMFLLNIYGEEVSNLYQHINTKHIVPIFQ